MEEPKIKNWNDFAIQTFYELGHIKESLEKIRVNQEDGKEKNQEEHSEIKNRLLTLEVSKKSVWSTVVNVGAIIAAIIGWLVALFK